MKLSIYEILENTNKLDSVGDRKKYLLEHDCMPIRILLKYCFDQRIKFLLPKGPAPYKPSDLPDAQGMLYTEARKMYLFVEGGNPNLTKPKREMLFINLLESLDPKDAELLVSIKDKKMPFKNITRNLVEKVYPGLIDE